MQANSKIIEKIESELFLTLFNYAVPFVNKKIIVKSKQNPTNNLENIIDQKPKIGLKDFRELESILLKNSKENVKTNKNITINSAILEYSLKLTKKNGNKNNFSISIEYGENENKETLKVSFNKDEKEIYSAETEKIKDSKDRVVPYSIKISYEINYAEERLSISYKQQLKSYMQQHIADKEDMTNRVTLKWLNILPETMMGGVLGFTYLGENFMGRRADLTGKTARMVDIHESIHTPDEYETRILTSWIMEKVKSKYTK